MCCEHEMPVNVICMVVELNLRRKMILKINGSGIVSLQNVLVGTVVSRSIADVHFLAKIQWS